MKFIDRFRSKPAPQSQNQQPAEAELSAATSTEAAEPVAEATPETTPEVAPEAVSEPGAAPEPVMVAEPSPVKVEDEQKSGGFFSRLKQGLKRTSNSFAEGMGSLLLGKKEIDEELFEELETQLLVADVGVEATRDIINSLTKQVSRRELANPDALYQALQKELTALLLPAEQPLQINTSNNPYVILMVGVNGVGKTTTIGKMTKRFQSEGKSVMLAAGDTFRAAAVEQLQVWGERNNVPVVAQHTGADSASVIFDAVQAAQARKVDVLIADTAGRLHNKDNLMEELKKVVRVMKKLDANAPHEVMLVLDAGTGQNALSQAKNFQEIIGVSGLTLTKLDGTAKGGIIFAISKQLGLPIRFIGVGEQVDDLRPFVVEDFVKALFGQTGQ